MRLQGQSIRRTAPTLCFSTSILRPVNRRVGIRTPGPNVVVIVAGSFTLIDEHCLETQYGPGQGFATGLDVHEGIAGPEGADFYGLYFLPADAEVLRVDASGPVCARR